MIEVSSSSWRKSQSELVADANFIFDGTLGAKQLFTLKSGVPRFIRRVPRSDASGDSAARIPTPRLQVFQTLIYE